MSGLKLFAKKPTVKEQVRASQRELGHGVRDLERELVSLKREEAKLIKEIKAAANAGNQQGARVLAKSLVRLRAQQTKLHASMAQMRGVKTSIVTASATSTVGNSMATASKAMAAVGVAMDPQKMQQTMQQFSKESAKMDMASEIMDDTIDDALDDEEAEEESSELMNSILDEIGIDMSAQLGAAPRNRVAVRQQQATAATEQEEDLTARLAALR
ncbi:hypothetical protein WJX72_008298 [[Myrmecia] bisecta]|uniref:Uncharacterized protein n=1 Tax=[Myrmecia] bisecta TaxID=41462 RepID=A0AAW1QG91_9CHLO